MSLNTALSGINAARSDLDVISNNIANANTTGFKGSRAEFADVFAVTGLNLSATSVGSGVRLAQVAQQFTQGDIETTGNSLDMAINGNGFFVIDTGNGVAYTRAGDFHESPTGTVQTVDGYALQVYPPNGMGGFNTSTLADLNLVSAQSSASATSRAGIVDNLPASASLPATATFSPADATSYNDANTFSVYDSQGGAHQATVYYVKTGTNAWNTYLYVDGKSANPAAPLSLQFGTDGQLTAPANGQLAFQPVDLGNGSNPLSLTLDFTKSTQFGTAYSPGTITQNGYEAGVLASIDVDKQGVVTAAYSNGQHSQLGQLAMVNFTNPQGLAQQGSANWTATSSSGTPIMGAAGNGQFGSVQSGALESSNTADTTAQLVNMIQAQQAYQANAQMLSTDNSLTSTLFNAISR
ncbi:flagellar hook protein FlgE [Fulvimonas sp. R45]|uniref:flagellar hook protein FlgE n=1 Tax=Fulvimonas sp. R45 TaxID=3045937 RepID=UPI00265F0FA7|nr:flagellar hook protein FlgE [Fulvimonas sp. R45]MDO1528338.1 flagellar hook protein FlgE [Fulvimonas sp. R45]